MDRHFKTFSFLAMIVFFVTACGAISPAQSKESALPKPATYQEVLAKSLNDRAVIDFISRNQCYPANQFHQCKDIGLAFWTDSDQIVKTVYLYSGHANGFRRYRGTLPYGLSFYDPLWKVELKLQQLDEDDTLQASERAGSPYEGSSPDHFHYWAIYRRLGMTVIYEVPFANQDAYIYAILVHS